MRLERILAKLEKEMEQGAVCCLQEVNNLPFSSFSLSLSLTHTHAPKQVCFFLYNENESDGPTPPAMSYTDLLASSLDEATPGPSWGYFKSQFRLG